MAFGLAAPPDRIAFLAREDPGDAAVRCFGTVTRWIYLHRYTLRARTMFYAFGLMPNTVVARFVREEGIVRATTIRTATQADVPALTDLITRSARQLSRGYYTEQEAESAIKHVFGVDSTLIADGTYYVVEVDGVLAACGGWSRRRTLYGGDQRQVGAAAKQLDPGRDAARIRALFVAPEFARRGFGRLLLTHCVAAANKAGFRMLELMSTLPGVPFYGALGFDSVEPVRDVLPDGVPLSFVRMTRRVDAPDAADDPMESRG